MTDHRQQLEWLSARWRAGRKARSKAGFEALVQEWFVPALRFVPVDIEPGEKLSDASHRVLRQAHADSVDVMRLLAEMQARFKKGAKP